MMHLGCVVLAAGKSSRFGSNKLLAPLEGIPLLAHTLQAIPPASFVHVLAVVSDQEVAEVCARCGVEVCAYPGGCQSCSIQTGLQALNGVDGCLFIMGDQPLLTTKSIQCMAEAFQAHPQRIYRLSYRGQPSSPTLFPSWCFPALMQLTGERGGMSIVEDDSVVEFVEASGAYELWDADTPQNFLKIQQYLQAHP